MYRKLTWLIVLVSMPALSTAVQAAGFSDDFDTPHNFLTDGLGAYAGVLSADVNALDASISRPGALYMQTTGASWDPGPGPMLYVEVAGDFVATVKVVDFAGALAAPVLHNDCGIVARDPAGAPGAENWVTMNYFPTWTAFIARNTTNNARAEVGAVSGTWLGVDTFALAAQYPYIQLERKGDDFYFRFSSDGVAFLPLVSGGGLYDGTQTPLVVNRPDLPDTLQVGLINATYEVTTGYVAFDDFSVRTPGPKVVWVSAMHPSTADANVPSDVGFVDLLREAGYEVDYTPGAVAGTSYWEALDPNKTAVLDAADLVIIGRDCNSAGVASDANEIAAWNGLKTPVMLMSSYIAAGNRWQWINSTSQDARKAYYDLKAVDPNLPLFADVALDANDVVAWYDPNVASGYASFINTADAGSGRVLAVRPDNGNMLIAEWGKGLPFYATSSQTPAGRRMFFNAGTQEISGQKTNWGVMNLNDGGKKIFLNAVAYMAARNPIAVAVENASFELPGTAKIKGWNGEGVAGTPAVDVPGWSSDKAVADSGVETGFGATDGTWTAFLMGADPSVWQLTNYIIDAEDIFELQVDARNTWQGTTLRVMMFYDESGIRIPVAFVNAAVTDEMQTLSLTFDAAEAPDAVGKRIGIELDNVTTVGDSWIGLDNVRLFDLEGR